MATIKQITKQIETSEKRIADFLRKVAMYEDRRDKNITAVNKKFGTTLTKDSIIIKVCGNERHHWKEFSLPADIREQIGFDAAYKITSAAESLWENTRGLEGEKNHLVCLQGELAELTAKEQSERDNYNNGLANALRTAMKDFREVWFDRMIKWHGRHYDYIMEQLPSAKERRNRVLRLQQYFDRFRFRRTHNRISNLLERVSSGCSEIISDPASRYDSRNAYLAEVQRNLEKSWDDGIVKLTKKCQGYGVDQSRVTACNPTMTSKGFEVVLRDGNPRVIHARIIWAAEYSDKVEPHVRYIVTERTTR